MILPSKHIKNCESLFGLSSIILTLIDKPSSIENLWSKFEDINNTKRCPTYHSYDNFILAMDFLYLIGKVDLIDNKLVVK